MGNHNHPANYRDLSGQRYGRLTVICRSNKTNQWHEAFWRCACDCGNETVVRSGDLKSGKCKSCGCLHKERFRFVKHGSSHTRLYRIWAAMKTRTTNPKADFYHLYGGRGITVCSEWLHDFSAFQEWALANGYAPDKSIDRIDNDQGYSPKNCRWATIQEQAVNKRDLHYVTYQGKTQPLSLWAKDLGIPYQTLQSRIHAHGWSIEKAFTTPVKGGSTHAGK